MKVTALSAATALSHEVQRMAPHKSLAQYDASPFLISWIEEYGLYMEYPFRQGCILGHSWTDNLGTSTMVNSLIKDPQRKIFTQAHELGHQILHATLLRNNPPVDLLPSGIRTPANGVEAEANRFAAHLLLPDDVLNADMREGNSRHYMKYQHHISYETLGYRIEDFLEENAKLSDEQAAFLSRSFMNSQPRSKNEPLYKFWRHIRLGQRPDDNEPFEAVNARNAAYYCDAELIEHRQRKAEIIAWNKRTSMLMAEDDQLGNYANDDYSYSLLADAHDHDDQAYQGFQAEDLPF